MKGFALGDLSGWQDSNLRPPGPKPGAITGLRYIPNLKIFDGFIGTPDQCKTYKELLRRVWDSIRCGGTV